MVERSHFSHTSQIPFPVGDVSSYLSRPYALYRLCPPWPLFSLPFCTQWQPQVFSFEDRKLIETQLQGPLYSWHATHTLSSLSSSSTAIAHDIHYQIFRERFFEHSIFIRPFHRRIVRDCIRLVQYRKRILQHDLICLQSYQQIISRAPVLLTGASGLIGSALYTFLQMLGFQVIRLVRRPPTTPNEYQWDPEKCIYPPQSVLEGCYGWICLSGISIGEVRWNKQNKEMLKKSRIIPLKALYKAMKDLRHPPRVFIGASGIGFYPHDKEATFSENGPQGSGFLAEMAHSSEQQIEAFASKTRAISLRFAPVLAYQGGILKKLIPIFKCGLGSALGNGHEWMSWIQIDDAISAIVHCLLTSTLRGAVNISSPFPVTSHMFASTLARTLSRPLFPISPPSWTIKMALGMEKAQELIFSSHRIAPQKLIDHEFRFSFPDLHSALGHTLGAANVEDMS